ncbi:hypothetical protein KIL84_022883, partial [Mauremys mutica]
MDSQRFNLQHLHSKTKVPRSVITHLLYADDCAILVHAEADLQSTLDLFSGTYHILGLPLNTGKTKVLHQCVPAQVAPILPQIVIGGEPLENIEHFPYLGSHLSQTANLDVEIEHMICCNCISFGKLLHRVFIDRALSMETKILFYNAVVTPTLLYEWETWVTYQSHFKHLEWYKQHCLRKILHMRWEHCCTNTSFLSAANITSVEAKIMKHQLCWAGHC